MSGQRRVPVSYTHLDSLAGIQYLSHLQSLVCPDAGLAELDVSGLPSLEYVDCRGNRFTALDLSQNASLVCLYCDTDVTVAGLDQAGLVCDDLLVKATSTGVGDGGSLVQMTFAYDAYGRLVQGDGKLYGYDELGRLSAVHRSLIHISPASEPWLRGKHAKRPGAAA